MNKKLKIVLAILAVLIIAVFCVWKYINKSTKDYTDSKPGSTYSFTEIIKKIETDTTNLRDKLIAINGPVRKIIVDSADISLEIGYDTISSSVICVVDKRHTKDFEKIKEGETVDVKGIVTALEMSEESVFGNTITLNSCVKNKK